MTTPTNPACTPLTNTRAPLWSRANLICPPGLTPAQNKAKILQYKGNANPLTKKQQLSRNIRGFGSLGNKVWATQNDYGSNPNVFNLTQQGNTLLLCPEPPPPPPIIVCPNGIQILDISNVATQPPFDLDRWNLNANTTIFKCQHLIIKNGESLFIGNNILIVEGTITINNEGSVENDNSGTITINNGGIINNYYIIENISIININLGGTINNNAGSQFVNVTGGIITNDGGTINNNTSGIIYNDGGTINNNNSGKINNKTGGNINNETNGTITNNNGTITNNGTINNDNGTTTNNINGTIYNYDSGTITNFSTFNNNGTINNANGLSTCGTGILNGSIPIIATGTLCPPYPPP